MPYVPSDKLDESKMDGCWYCNPCNARTSMAVTSVGPSPVTDSLTTSLEGEVDSSYLGEEK